MRQLLFLALLASPLAALAGHAQAPVGGAASRQAATPDTTMRFLQAMLGVWRPADAPGPRRPPPDYVVHSYEWTVGGKGMRVREGYRGANPEGADLDGILFWNPATEVVEFSAVAGAGPDQGRVFRGEYRRLADGVIERVYRVTYRSAADTPGEELGGRTRLYRERYTFVTPDSVAAQLDWWRGGEWKPFGPGKYSFVRRAVP